MDRNSLLTALLNGKMTLILTAAPANRLIVRRSLRLELSLAALALSVSILFGTPVFSWAAVGWSGSAGWREGCTGWNCDGKNPCTGLGCPGEGSGSAGSSKTTSKTGSSASTGASKVKGESAPNKNAKPSNDSAKGPAKNSKDTQTLPDVETLTEKSKTSDGWGGSRNSDSPTDGQRSAQDAAKNLPDVGGLTGGGKPAAQGWDGSRKSDSRTIEQKLN